MLWSEDLALAFARGTQTAGEPLAGARATSLWKDTAAAEGTGLRGPSGRAAGLPSTQGNESLRVRISRTTAPGMADGGGVGWNRSAGYGRALMQGLRLPEYKVAKQPPNHPEVQTDPRLPTRCNSQDPTHAL